MQTLEDAGVNAEERESRQRIKRENIQLPVDEGSIRSNFHAAPEALRVGHCHQDVGTGLLHPVNREGVGNGAKLCQLNKQGECVAVSTPHKAKRVGSLIDESIKT